LAASVVLVVVLLAEQAVAVRPFITDDARIVYKGQLETESYAGVVFDRRAKPQFEIRSLQGMSLTDRLEIIAGGFGVNYQDNQARPLDMVFQPKYVINRSFGPIPSVSAAAAILFPLSGNRQQWNSYSMMHLSWFLFRPQISTDPYDNGLAIHVNLGTKSQYDAGLGGRYSSKFYWAAGFEAITWIRALRFLGETFNGDPFTFEEEFPAFQTGLRWYKTPSVQMDFVVRGVRNGAEEARPGELVEKHWSYTFQVGLRVLFDVFD
jgi:hypothetical protein